MKITCNVIEDLLPLYVDQLLSEDSRSLVEEHIRECEACQKHLEILRKEQAPFETIKPQKASDLEAQKALKGIRRTILKKRILAVCIAVVCVLAATRAGYYFYAEKEIYLSFEDSGLEMRGDQLYATKTYYGRFSTIVSPDQTIMFLREMETAEIRKRYPSTACDLLLIDFGNQLEDPEEMEKQENENRIRGIEKVYYLTEEYASYQFDYDDLEKGAAQTKELEENCILLWEKVSEGGTES